MITPVILEVPEDFNPLSDDLDEYVSEFFEVSKLQFSADIMDGTHAVNGRKLILAMTSNPEELEEWANDVFPLKASPANIPNDRIPDRVSVVQDASGNDRAVAALNLAMTKAHAAGDIVNHAGLLDYFDPIREYDIDGEIASETPRTDLVGVIPYWAGRKWVY